MRKAWVVLLLALFVCVSFFAKAQSARQVAQKTFPSVVLLVMEDANGQPVSLGGGFFVKEYVVATNLHVIEKAEGGYARVVGKKRKYDIAGHVGIDNRMDLALLKLTGVRAPKLTLGESEEVAVGDEVYAVGNPRGLEGTFSAGIISSIRQIDSDTLLQITAPISPGSSGGPVLDGQGEVIGVAVATFRGGQNLNFAIPVSYLAMLLSDKRPVVALSAKTSGREQSVLHALGGRSIEGVFGENFLWADQLWSSYRADYSFTLRNRLRTPVENVYCLVVFYARDGRPVDVGVVHFNDVIPAGLGRRVRGSVDGSVKKLTTDASWQNRYLSLQSPTGKVEFRVLDFQIIE